jgi:hypothetical protein
LADMTPDIILFIAFAIGFGIGWIVEAVRG